MSRLFPAGVATGQMVTDIFQHAKENKYALPAVNVIGSSNVNATMEKE
jgi:fructose-bisphosphate aldolase class II